MNFKEALSKVLQNESVEFSGNSFWLYSRLSDLCTSYIDRQKICILFEVDKKLHIVRSIMWEGRVAEIALKAAYPAVKDVLPAENYTKLIACIADAAFPKQKGKSHTTNKVNLKAAEAKRVGKKKKPKTVNSKSNVKPFYYSYRPSHYKNVWPWITGVAVGVVIAVIVVCLCLFGRHLNWSSWQHIIGAIGGLMVFAGITSLTYLLDDKVILDYYLTAFISLLCIVVINFMLYCFLHNNYKIIFIWFSGYATIWGGLLAVYSFDDVEEGWAIVHIIESLVILAAMILGLIFL